MVQTRRTFIKSVIAVSAGLPLLQGCIFDGKKIGNSENLYNLFYDPPATSKPFVRWWWNGDKLSEKEILRELDVMKEAGIGGVEINPIAFPGGDDLGIPSLKWLSPEWIEMVKIALKGAEERGIICDIIVGSGWPFGGEFITPDEQTQLMTLSGQKVKGPGKISVKVKDMLEDASPQVASQYKGAISELHSVCIAPLQMDTFKPAINVPFEKGTEVVNIDLPEGEHILYGLVKITGFQAVINGAPGAAGQVLNHYDTKAVDKFLSKMSDNLFPAIQGLKGFRAMFCDSMELEGANWCDDFIEEFKRRRNYNVEPYLPFILYKVGHMGHALEGAVTTELTGNAKEEVDRVRYDFFVTCMDIVRDRFLKPYTEWCNKHGFKSRVQPYGREFHPLEASMYVDIPECETWLWNADGDKKSNFADNPTYTNVNKFVASAVHYSGKKIVSCEEITNTTCVFNATLERIKITGDQSNTSGVTHSILHGFNYSPLEAPFPGWIRYGTFFNERNPWWPFFKLWSTYKARLSTILQESDFFADIAVMHPLADMWTLYGPQRDPFPGRHYPTYQYKIWEAIHRNGNSCDYTSEEIIQKSTFEKGFIKYNNRKYHTLILIKVESMMPETAEALLKFVKNGGKLIFIEAEPQKSTGFVNHKENDEKVKQTITTIKKDYATQVYTVVPPSDTDSLQWFKTIQQQCGIVPYVKIDSPSPFVNQIKHQTEDKDIYFFTNCHTDNKIAINATFENNGKVPWIWNLETGERYLYPSVSGQTLHIELNPAESQLIVFENSGDSKYAMPAKPTENTSAAEIKGWKVTMKHFVTGETVQREIEDMADLTANNSIRTFGGYLIYEKEIEDTIGTNYIDLGRVYGVSEVTVNGEKLGCRWYGRHLYQLPENIAKEKVKTVKVTITTTIGNYLKSTPENKVGYDWTRWQAWQPIGIYGPVRLL